MQIKGKKVLELLDLMQGALDDAVAPEQNNSDDESFVTITSTPIQILHASASNHPDELLDINVIATTVVDVLRAYSIDENKTSRAAKLFNALNTDFNESASYLDLLVESMIESSKNPALTIVHDLTNLFNSTIFKSVPHVDKLLNTLLAYELYILMQEWEKNWDTNYFSFSEDQSQRANLLKIREELFILCDQLHKEYPKEFKKMLIANDFPARFFLDYLSYDYHREIAIQNIDSKLLILSLAVAVNTLWARNFGVGKNVEIKKVLNKIAVALETGTAGYWTADDFKKILGPIIIKLISGYIKRDYSIDSEYERHMAIDFIKIVRDTNITDENGDTPLHAAIPLSGWGNVKLSLIEWLLDNNANVNAINSQGQTPLAEAAKTLKDRDAAAVISAMINSQSVSIETFEQGLYNAILSNHIIDSKVFELLTQQLRSFSGWDPVAFFVNLNVFSFDTIQKPSIYDARQNITNVTKLLSAMQLFKIPFNIIFAAKVKVRDLGTPAIVGALLANKNLCEHARNNDSDNILEYLKQHPEICDYLNQNIENVMKMLRNINPENGNNRSSLKACFATSDDILGICKFGNNESPEYLLFILRILVGRVFSTLLVPVALVSLLPDSSTWVIEEHVKQQLKSAVFALIAKDVDVEPIKEYLRARDSGLNQIFIRSFVHKFLNEIHEREIAHRQDKLSLSSEITHTYGRLSSSFPSDGVLDIEAEPKGSKSSPQVTCGPHS